MATMTKKCGKWTMEVSTGPRDGDSVRLEFHHNSGGTVSVIDFYAGNEGSLDAIADLKYLCERALELPPFARP